MVLPEPKPPEVTVASPEDVREQSSPTDFSYRQQPFRKAALLDHELEAEC